MYVRPGGRFDVCGGPGTRLAAGRQRRVLDRTVEGRSRPADGLPGLHGVAVRAVHRGRHRSLELKAAAARVAGAVIRPAGVAHATLSPMHRLRSRFGLRHDVQAVPGDSSPRCCHLLDSHGFTLATPGPNLTAARIYGAITFSDDDSVGHPANPKDHLGDPLGSPAPARCDRHRGCSVRGGGRGDLRDARPQEIALGVLARWTGLERA